MGPRPAVRFHDDVVGDLARTVVADNPTVPGIAGLGTKIIR